MLLHWMHTRCSTREADGGAGFACGSRRGGGAFSIKGHSNMYRGKPAEGKAPHSVRETRAWKRLTEAGGEKG